MLVALAALMLAACQPGPRSAPPAASPPSATYPVPYSARSPEYGAHTFVWGNPETTARDLGRLLELGFGWHKSLFQWRLIEGKCRGCYDWTEADRVVKASNDAGIKLIARLDFQPQWARSDGAHNGPPDDYADLANFVRALVDRYKSGSPHGRLHAIEIWNEPNLAREWGNQPINRQQAADYVRLLKLSYQAAKSADPQVMVLTAGLSPTGWDDDTARPDDVYLQWLYDAGMKGSYDALSAHGNAQAPIPEAAPGSLGKPFDHPSFYFRRIEQLREIMVLNGDSDRQVWVLEFGWTADKVHPEYSWYAVSEEQKGENIVRAFRYAGANWGPWIGMMTVWTLADPSWTKEREEYWWAITDPDGKPRSALGELTRARQKGLLPGLQ